MKRKITRIQRWVDRFAAACDSSRWDSALVEADCLSAELREAREELWNRVENPESVKHRIFSRNAVSMSVRSLGIAMFIVLVSTMPLAVEAEKPWTAAAVTPAATDAGEHLSWVTQEEEELLQILRADLSGNNTAVAAQKASVPVKPAAKPIIKKSASAAEVKPAQKNPAEMPAEDLLALIQVGEKALRGGEPVIKVIR